LVQDRAQGVLAEERSIAWPHIARRKPVQNSFTESLSGCVIPVLPFRPATARGSSEQRRRNATPAGVDHVSRGSFSAIGLGTLSSARVAALSCRRCGLSSFWPFWRGRARHAQSDIGLRISRLLATCSASRRPLPWQFCAAAAAPFSIRGLPQLSADPLDQVTLALEPFAHRLAVSADRLGPLAHSSLRWCFVGATPLHLASVRRSRASTRWVGMR